MHGGNVSESNVRRGGHRTRLWATAISLAGMTAFVLTLTSTAVSASPSSRSHHATHKAGSTFNACEVTDTGGIHDESFNEAAYDGMLDAAAADKSIKTHYLSSHAETTYVPFITKFLHSDCGIIVTVGFDMATATLKAAEKNPSQKFTIVDNTYTKVYKNLLALHYETNEDAFLGGYLAAAMSASGISGLKTGIVGTFGGQNIPTVDVYMDGWVAGVYYYNKVNHAHIKALGWTPKAGSKPGSLEGSGLFTNTFTDEGKGYTDGSTLLAQGADIIFPVAGDVGLGAARAVKDKGTGYDMEWVDTDGCLLAKEYCSLFITTVEKGIEPSVEDAVLSAAHGTFKGGQYNGTLANGGVGLAPYHDWASRVPSKVKKAITSMKKEIEAGKLCTSAICWSKYAAS